MGKMKERLKKIFSLIKLYNIYSNILISSINLIVLTFIILLISILINYKENFELILKIVEFVIIGSGTLAILSFTYALTKSDKEETRKEIVHSGESLFQSTLTFIVGFVLFIGVRLMPEQNPIGGYLGIFSGVFDIIVFLVFLFLLLIGVISLMLSGAFLIRGVGELIEVFKRVRKNELIDQEFSREEYD